MFRFGNLPKQGTLIEKGLSSLFEQQSTPDTWARMSG
jgi:hypothetical protein